jgi:D-cysteine desulfhydrase
MSDVTADRTVGDRLAIERTFALRVGALPRAACTRLPTRVHRLERFGAAVGAHELWIKRDDETSPLYGGNKPRKLDFLLGDALARGKRTVMTFGGIGTNHGLATAVFARQHELRTILLLLHQPVTAKVRRMLLTYQALGAELHCAPALAQVVVKGLALCARELARGGLPYIIQTGGTSPLGVLGYINAALELKEQIDAGELPAPDWIFVPTGSGGTVAGLVAGCRLAGLPTRVAGVLVTDILPPPTWRLARLANQALALLARAAADVPAVRVTTADVHIVRGYIGDGYGSPSDVARRARDALRDLEGIGAETTYTGKCLAALTDLARQPPYRDAHLLYWHTFSAVDPGAALEPLPDWKTLPPSFHQFFVGPAVED